MPLDQRTLNLLAKNPAMIVTCVVAYLALPMRGKNCSWWGIDRHTMRDNCTARRNRIVEIRVAGSANATCESVGLRVYGLQTIFKIASNGDEVRQRLPMFTSLLA